MICCSKEKLEQKLELEMTLEQKLELTLELVGSGRQNDQKSFLTDVCGRFHFSFFRWMPAAVFTFSKVVQISI